jgi:pre-mRNA cleavage complex 2 protein Pcf11
MDAYVIMDSGTRKAMEGLLKTWKQPVPESMDARPVFQPEVTRDIENALIKFRTVAVQQQALSQRPGSQHSMPARPMPNMPWGNTPTPPQNVGRFTAPNDPRRQVSEIVLESFIEYTD